MRFALIPLLVLFLVSCATTPPKPVSEKPVLTRVAFDDLPGWGSDDFAPALAAFQRSCAAQAQRPDSAQRGFAGKVAVWRPVCADARQTAPENARAFFERAFTPYAVAGKDGAEGLFTGYYMPELRGALQRGGAFQTPLYARPGDLISVDLGLFKPELKGQHIVGKVAGSKLVLYDDRAAIAGGALDGRAQALAYTDDPAGAFFLEIQGSGRVRLDDGTVLPVGYDGANGRSYVAIGRILADRGEIAKPVTMPAIKQWFATHPDRAQKIMNENPSYVFFRRLPSEDAVGAEGVVLTPQRSLAVDPAMMPLGIPLWIDTTDGFGAPLKRLMIAQDTGGAIKGAVRGDFFWGAGPDAGVQAGAMQSRGRYYALLPRGIGPDDE